MESLGGQLYYPWILRLALSKMGECALSLLMNIFTWTQRVSGKGTQM